MENCYRSWHNTIGADGKLLEESFGSLVKNNCSFIIEQQIIKDETEKPSSRFTMNKLPKLAITWNAKQSMSLEKSYEYINSDFAEALLGNSSPSLRKCISSSAVDVISGKEHQKFNGLLEFWWDSAGDMNKDYRMWNKRKISDGKTLIAILDDHVNVQAIFGMEEFIVKELES
jgi:hypothetical protein